MRWIRTASGEKAHAVFKRHDHKSACGIPLSKAVAITPPGETDRCGQCDYLWRARGLAQRPVKLAQDPAVYAPQFTYRDWEEL